MGFDIDEGISAICASCSHEVGEDGIYTVILDERQHVILQSRNQIIILVQPFIPLNVPLQSHASTNPRDELLTTCDLWQVCHLSSEIKSTSYNNVSNSIAKGAIAVSLIEGKCIMLLPQPSRQYYENILEQQKNYNEDHQYGKLVSRECIKSSHASVQSMDDYIRIHLGLYRRKWIASLEWNASTVVNRLKWTSRGDSLLLIGGGSHIYIWEIIEEYEGSVKVYLQQEFSPGPRIQRNFSSWQVQHMDISANGDYLVTAGASDRLLKLWDLNVAMHPSTSEQMQPIFLPHSRALQTVCFVKPSEHYAPFHCNKAQSHILQLQQMPCTILMSLDVNNELAFWRETITSPKRFICWKRISSSQLLQSFNPITSNIEPNSSLKVSYINLVQQHSSYTIVDSILRHRHRNAILEKKNAGKVDPSETRGVQIRKASPSTIKHFFSDAFLNDRNVLNALMTFHYGSSSLIESKSNDLLGTTVDSLANESLARMNSRLLGDSIGSVADSIAGEVEIIGNLPINDALALTFICCILENGEVIIFQNEIPLLSSKSPRVSCVLRYAELQSELCGSTIFRVRLIGQNIRDEINDIGLTLELLYQRKSPESYLKLAHVYIQREKYSHSDSYTTGTLSARKYRVRAYEVIELCQSLISTNQKPIHNYETEVLSFTTPDVMSCKTTNLVGKTLSPLPVLVIKFQNQLEFSRWNSARHTFSILHQPTTYSEISSDNLVAEDVPYHSTISVRNATINVIDFAVDHERGVVYYIQKTEDTQMEKLFCAYISIEEQPAAFDHLMEQSQSGGLATWNHQTQAKKSKLQSLLQKRSIATDTHIPDIACRCLDNGNDVDTSPITQVIKLLHIRVAWALSDKWFSTSMSSISTDRNDRLSAVMGLLSSGYNIILWLFAFDEKYSSSGRLSIENEEHSDNQGMPMQLNSPLQSMRLYLKKNLRLDTDCPLVCISALPFIRAFDTSFCSVDTKGCFSIWSISNASNDDTLHAEKLLNLKDVIDLALEEEYEDSTDNNCTKRARIYSYHRQSGNNLAYRKDTNTVSALKSKRQFVRNRKRVGDIYFQTLNISDCGRAAVLFQTRNQNDGRQDNNGPLTESPIDSDVLYLCLFHCFEQVAEAVIALDPKSFGNVESINWCSNETPLGASATANSASSLLVLSSLSLSVFQLVQGASETNTALLAWRIIWSTTRSIDIRRNDATKHGQNDTQTNLAIPSSIYPYCVSQTSEKNSLGLLDVAVLNDIIENIADMHGQRASYPANHPLVLMMLLLRGSYYVLDAIFQHIKSSMESHMSNIYLQMTNDEQQIIQTIPNFPISKILAAAELDQTYCSSLYKSGKAPTRKITKITQSKTQGLFDPHSSQAQGLFSTAPARAQDLFSVAPARAENLFSTEPGRAQNIYNQQNSRAKNLFVTGSSMETNEAVSSSAPNLLLETEDLSTFFHKNRQLIGFFSSVDNGTEMFLAIVDSARRIKLWEKNSAEVKDEAALRFGASLSWYLSLASKTSAVLPNVGITSEQIAWASVSGAQEVIISHFFPDNRISWETIVSLRLPFWLKNVDKLKLYSEKAAQLEYASSKDPFAVTILYVLLGKTKLLSSLFKMTGETRIATLLSNDFSDVRWQNAATKNAYVLKGKQRYTLAAAFFLLGGKLKEAVSVAELADPTLVLSLLIARISESHEFVGLCERSDNEVQKYSKDVSVVYDLLEHVVLPKSKKYGDIYLTFVCHYFLGHEVSETLSSLLNLPAHSVCTVMNQGGNSISNQYWGAIGESLWSSVELLRFLRKVLKFSSNNISEHESEQQIYTQKVCKQQLLCINRLVNRGCAVPAIVHMRSVLPYIIASCVMPLFDDSKKTSSNYTASEFLALRDRITLANLIDQIYHIVNRYEDKLEVELCKNVKSSDLSSNQARETSYTYNTLGNSLNNEIESIVRFLSESKSIKSFALPREFSPSDLRDQLRTQATLILKKCGSFTALHRLISTWTSMTSLSATQEFNEGMIENNSHTSQSRRVSSTTIQLRSYQIAQPSPILDAISLVRRAMSFLARGDLTTQSGGILNSRDLHNYRGTLTKADAYCCDLIDVGLQLLRWLWDFYTHEITLHREDNSQSDNKSTSEFVRVATGAVYSIAAICIRFLRNPCCVYRVLLLIFPHRSSLTFTIVDSIKEIVHERHGICLDCSQSSRPSNGKHQITVRDKEEKQRQPNHALYQDIPDLYKAFKMLRQSIVTASADIKTNRLNRRSDDEYSTNVVGSTRRSSSTRQAPSFSYCQYWQLFLILLTCNVMPTHIKKLCVDGASSLSPASGPATALVSEWVNYAAGLSLYAAPHLLLLFAESFQRQESTDELLQALASHENIDGLITAATTESLDMHNSIHSKLYASRSAGSSPVASAATATFNDAKFVTDDNANHRLLHVLRCGCNDRCSWKYLVNFLLDKNDLMLPLNLLMEKSTDELKDLAQWNYLPPLNDSASRYRNKRESKMTKKIEKKEKKIEQPSLTKTQKRILAAEGQLNKPALSESLPAASSSSVIASNKELKAATLLTKLDIQCVYRSDAPLKSLCRNYHSAQNQTLETILCSNKTICRASSSNYCSTVAESLQFKGMYGNPETPSNKFFGGNDMSLGNQLPSSSPLSRSPAASGTPTSQLTPQGDTIKLPSFKPTTVTSHPLLPLFVSGDQRGKIFMWSFDSLSCISSFENSSPSSSVVESYPLNTSAQSPKCHIKRISFDHLGQHMAAVNSLGQLSMWQFSALNHAAPYRIVNCHDRGAKSVTFLNSTSTVATVGSSSVNERRSLAVWDLLAPPNSAVIASPYCHLAGAASVVFSSSHQLLISGGESGSLCVFDLRQRRLLHTISNAHETAITTLSINSNNRYVLSGSASGELKVWSLPIFREVAGVPKVHAKASTILGDTASNFLSDAAQNIAINVTNSSWGVTDALATDNYFFTSGTDGSVQRTKIPSI